MGTRRSGTEKFLLIAFALVVAAVGGYLVGGAKFGYDMQTHMVDANAALLEQSTTLLAMIGKREVAEVQRHLEVSLENLIVMTAYKPGLSSSGFDPEDLPTHRRWALRLARRYADGDADLPLSERARGILQQVEPAE